MSATSAAMPISTTTTTITNGLADDTRGVYVVRAWQSPRQRPLPKRYPALPRTPRRVMLLP